MLELIDKAGPGPWSTVIGMIADFLTVKREYAPLIDLALGDWAQRFVVRDGELDASRGRAEDTVVGTRQLFAAVGDSVESRRLGKIQRCKRLQNNRLVQVSLLSRIKAASPPAPLPEGEGVSQRRSIRVWSRWRSNWCRASIRSWPICRPSFWAAR